MTKWPLPVGWSVTLFEILVHIKNLQLSVDWDNTLLVLVSDWMLVEQSKELEVHQGRTGMPGRFPQLKASDTTQTTSGCSWLVPLELHDGDNDPGQDRGTCLLQENRWTAFIFAVYSNPKPFLVSLICIYTHADDVNWPLQFPCLFFRMGFGPCGQWSGIVIRF